MGGGIYKTLLMKVVLEYQHEYFRRKQMQHEATQVQYFV